jgi:shikimate dehydrogenase
VTAWPERLVLLGHPLGHSLSPVMQNAALLAAGIDLTYEALDVPRSALDDTLDELHRQRAAGNVTVPYKEAVRAACDRVTETARAVGAVNTFWTAIDGARVGDNTDVVGFNAAAHTLLGGIPSGAQVAVLGAGGAAAAVLHAIEGWPSASVRVYSRTRGRAEELVRRFRIATVTDSAEAAARRASLVVNATPVGLRDDALPLAVELLPEGGSVLDLAYRTGETALVRAARTRGLRAADGLTMLVEQGAAAFERWFGVTADREAMWEALKPHR